MDKINYVIGDATDPQFDTKCAMIVHICNDIGLWGSGFVMALSRKWEEPEKSYRYWNSVRQMNNVVIPFELGQYMRVLVQGKPVIQVCNLIGQEGVGYDKDGNPPIRYEAVREGLRNLVDDLNYPENWSFHMPRIGCGLAGGDWDVISDIINQEICNKGISVTVYDLPGQHFRNENGKKKEKAERSQGS